MQATDVQMIADRWMLESRRLINWGSYEGYHEFRPSTDHKLPVTLLAGASESGKSTLVDAQISLLYPTGTPFNKASNSGRSERSDYTYLRGMVGVGSTETGDEPLYLRGRDENGAPQPVWGAIVDTYRNQTTGQVLSCAKFLYLMPGDGRGDVRRQYVVWGKPVDPRRMDQYRDAPFTPAQLKATYPDCLTFPSAEAFHTHIWSAMGLSEAACRLLHKIQSADAPSRLDDIFKQGVLGVPEALDLARTTVEDYERYDENFHAMDEKTRRMDTLRGIQQAYGEYAAARGKARAFEPVKPAVDGTVPAVLRDWALARMRGEVAVQLPADRAEQQNSEAEAKLLRRRTEDLRTRLDMIRGQMQGLDGGNLTRLELELDQARRTLEDVQANRTRIEQTFASIGETLPGDALDTLASLRDGGRKFGVVCVDPPAFIKRKKDAEQGLNAYRRVNDLGLQLVENGGILMSCSCSHHLEAEALRRLIAQCAAKRGLNTQLLYQGFQGPDHPVHPSMPETAYLKVFILRVWKD